MNSQSLNVGFRLEPAFLLSEKMNSSEILFTPYSVYLTTAFTPIEWVSVELRPGFFLAGEEYSGFEIGGFFQYNILPTDLYIIFGINNHSNTESDHNSGGSYKKDILYKAIGIGYKKDTKLKFDITYYWTSDKVYGYTFTQGSDGYSVYNPKEINGLIKFGFCLSFDVL